MRLIGTALAFAVLLNFLATIEIRENDLLSPKKQIKLLLLIWLLPYLGFLIYLTLRQWGSGSDSDDGWYIGNDEVADYYSQHHCGGAEHHDIGLHDAGHDIN